MKNLSALMIMLIILVSSTNSFADIDAATVWEVRTTGATTNSGGFNPDNASPGTDYSQQDSAEDSGTDLVTGDGDEAGCWVSSASHNFIAGDQGNIVQVTEAGDGFTLGYYEVVTTNSNTAQFDRACGSDGALTGGDWSLGGALSTLTVASSTASVSGNTIYIKSGTYNQDMIFHADIDNLDVIGYDSSRDDYPTGDDRPYINASGFAKGIDIVSGSKTHNILNLKVGNASGDGIEINDGMTYLMNVRSTNNGDDGVGGGCSKYLFGCELDNNTDCGTSETSYRDGYVYYTYAHDNGDIGIYPHQWNYDGEVSWSLSEGNSGGGLSGARYNDAEIFMIGNTAYNNTGVGISWRLNADPTEIYVINNVSDDSGGADFEEAGTGIARVIANNVGEETWTNVDTALFDVNNVTADPGLGSGGVVSAGSNVLDAGFDVATFTSATGFKTNIGLDQDDNASGGSSAQTTLKLNGVKLN